MTGPSRADMIRERLSKHFIARGCAASAVPPGEWHAVTPALGPQARLGSGWILPSESAAPYVFTFCVELIDRITASLSDTDLGCYLGALEHLGDAQIAHLSIDSSLDDAYQRSLDEATGTAARAVALLERTHMRALVEQPIQNGA